MPANKKHLETSGWQRFAKIMAAFPGGFLITVAMHMVLAVWTGDHRTILVTYAFTLFLVWITVLILPFLFRNGWKCLALYTGIILLLSLLIYWGKSVQIN